MESHEDREKYTMTEAFRAGFNAYMEKFSEDVSKARVAPVLSEDQNNKGRIIKTSALNYLIKISAQVDYWAPEWDEFYKGPTNTYRKNPRGFDVPPGYVLIRNDDRYKSPYLMRADSEAAQKSMRAFNAGAAGQAAQAPAAEQGQPAEATPAEENAPAAAAPTAATAPSAAPAAASPASPASPAPTATPGKSTRVRYDETTGRYSWSDGRQDPFTDAERRSIEKIHARRGRTKPINWGDQPAPAAAPAASPAPAGEPAPAAAAPVENQRLGVIPGVTDKNTPNVGQPAKAAPTVRPGNIAAIS